MEDRLLFTASADNTIRYLYSLLNFAIAVVCKAYSSPPTLPFVDGRSWDANVDVESAERGDIGSSGPRRRKNLDKFFGDDSRKKEIDAPGANMVAVYCGPTNKKGKEIKEVSYLA